MKITGKVILVYNVSKENIYVSRSDSIHNYTIEIRRGRFPFEIFKLSMFGSQRKQKFNVNFNTSF